MVVLLETPAPDPVTVTVYVPSEAEGGTDIVRMLENVGLPLEGLNEKDRPLGEDEALRLTDAVVGEPLASVTVIVEVLLAPRQIDSVDGLAEIEKSIT
jgi:hypothetical protein